MKIENLKVDLVVANYKQLCELLEVNAYEGNQKKAQLKELNRFIKYEKQGQKFFIQEIYSEPLEVVDNRTTSKRVLPYIEEMQLLLLDFLVYCEGDITISRSGLYKVLSMVNGNYGEYNGKKKKLLADKKNLSVEVVKDFYSSSSRIFNEAITTVLTRLQSARLIYHQKVKMIVRLDSKPQLGTIKHVENISIDENEIENINYLADINSIDTTQNIEVADDETIKKIIAIEEQVLKSMGLGHLTKKGYVYYINRYEEFVKKVNKQLVEKLNIAWSYDAHKILFNMDSVVETRNYLLEKRAATRVSVNDKVISQLKNRLKKEDLLDYEQIIDGLVREVVKINRDKLSLTNTIK